MDCYRLEDQEEDLGFEEYFETMLLQSLNGVSLFLIYYLINI